MAQDTKISIINKAARFIGIIIEIFLYFATVKQNFVRIEAIYKRQLRKLPNHGKTRTMNRWMLIYGGRSGEHEVSLRSAAFVNRSLQEAGIEVVPLGISLQGFWYLQDPQNPESFLLDLKEDPSRLVSLQPGKGFLRSDGSVIEMTGVFPVIHGTYGEDGTLQGLLEMMDMPYVGAHVLSSALAMDKITAKILWESQGLPIVPYRVIEQWQWQDEDFDRKDFVKEALSSLGLPLFIKPSNTGSSVGVCRAETIEEIQEGIQDALRFDTRVLIEKAVNAREIELSLMGNHQVKAFLPGEIAPTHSFYDYDAKYIDPDGAALIIPADLSPEMMEEARTIAVEAYRQLNLKGLSRVDLFLDKESDQFYINEINTMPGFTSISMFPMLCKEGGLEGASLMKELIELALERYEEHNHLQFRRD